MDTKELITIGELSKFCGVSVQALRLYDKQGLLNPIYINEENGYRYYHPLQAAKALTIKGLRRSTFSLDDIKTHTNSDNVNLINSLHRKTFEKVQSELIQLEKIKTRLESRLVLFDEYQFLERNNLFNLNQMYLKEIPKRRVIYSSQRGHVQSYDLVKLSADVLKNEKKHDLTASEPVYYVYHEPFCIDSVNFMEVHLETNSPAENYSFIKEIKADLYGCMYYQGTYAGIKDCQDSLLKEIKKRGYRALFPLYLKRYLSQLHTKKDKIAVELQIAIEKLLFHHLVNSIPSIANISIS